MKMVSLGEWHIRGEPATFLTSAEAAWNDRLRAGLAGFGIRPGEGIHVRFEVSAWTRRGHHFDLDNLAKPVFDSMGRPQVYFVDVATKIGPEPGVRVRVDQEFPAAPTVVGFWMRRLLVGSQRNEEIHSSLRGIAPLDPNGPLRVHLLVHEPVLLTDFGFSGFIKPTLDRFWPVIGGQPHSPKDHRFRHLVAQYSDARGTGVSVAIEELRVGPD